MFNAKSKRLRRVIKHTWREHAISINCLRVHHCWLSLRFRCWIWISPNKIFSVSSIMKLESIKLQLLHMLKSITIRWHFWGSTSLSTGSGKRNTGDGKIVGSNLSHNTILTVPNPMSIHGNTTCDLYCDFLLSFNAHSLSNKVSHLQTPLFLVNPSILLILQERGADDLCLITPYTWITTFSFDPIGAME